MGEDTETKFADKYPKLKEAAEADEQKVLALVVAMDELYDEPPEEE